MQPEVKRSSVTEGLPRLTSTSQDLLNWGQNMIEIWRAPVEGGSLSKYSTNIATNEDTFDASSHQTWEVTVIYDSAAMIANEQYLISACFLI